MKGRFQLSLAVVFFIAAGLGLTLYKHFVLGFPLARGETTTLWSIEAQIEFNAEGGPAKATLTLPDNQSGVRILDESFASPGYGINQFEEQGQRRAEWSIREANGSQSLFYKVQLYPEVSAPSATDNGVGPDSDYNPVSQSLPQPYQTAAESLVRQVTEKSADARSFAGTLISEFAADSPGQNTNMLLGMTDSRQARTQMLIRLLQMADIPVRLVRGLYLEDGRRRQPIVDMLEVLTDNGWLMFDPETGRSGNPENFFLWQRGGKSLLDVMGGRNSRVSFSMISQAVPARDMAIRTSRADEATLVDFSIYALPLEVQNAFKGILLIPIGTLVVLIMRILVGLRTSGTFMPVLIAVAFLETQLLPGLVIFITIVSIGLWIRSILSQLNMLLVARLAAVMIVVIGIMGVMSIFSWKLGITQALTVTFFPMIILAWTIERMSILWEEEGPKDVLIEGFGSLLVATISYLFMSNPTVEHLTFNFPELLLAVLGVTLMLGQYTGYRLLELRRFKPLVEKSGELSMKVLRDFFGSFTSPGRLREAGILSMNSRNLDYVIKYNPRKLLPKVDNKLTTKHMAEKAGVDVPKLLGVVSYQHDIKNLDTLLESHECFVIKPAQGSGGKGILVITGRDGDRYVKASGETLEFEDVNRHVSNILGGLYSLGGKSDVAMIESLILADPVFNDYSVEGVPDIRMIVFRGFPVMAMLRLATRASDGKANLHQGAVGVGLDIATGRSLRAVQFDKPIQIHPDTQHNFDSLRVPHWDRLLKLTAACYGMTGLGYLGVDMVLDKNLGPQILELNARPGLAIQIANGSGIQPRLEKVEALSNWNLPIEERVDFAKENFNSLPS